MSGYTVLAIGQFLVREQPMWGPRDGGHVVRLGPVEQRIADEAAFALWDAIWTRPATNSEIESFLPPASQEERATTLANIERQIDEFVERGLMVRYRPETGLARLAARLRPIPLYVGLGDDERDISQFKIGVPGAVVATLSEAQFNLWSALDEVVSVEHLASSLQGDYLRAETLGQATKTTDASYQSAFDQLIELARLGVAYFDVV